MYLEGPMLRLTQWLSCLRRLRFPNRTTEQRFSCWIWIFGVRVAPPDTERLMELYISAGLFKEQNGREMNYYALFQGVEEWERGINSSS